MGAWGTQGCGVGVKKGEGVSTMGGGEGPGGRGPGTIQRTGVGSGKMALRNNKSLGGLLHLKTQP